MKLFLSMNNIILFKISMLLLRRASKRPTTVSHLTLQQQQQRHIHATSQSYMGIDKVAENKIAEWLHNRGDESIGSTKKGKEISSVDTGQGLISYVRRA